MAPPRIRMTTPVRLVLDAMAHAKADDPLWGYRLCEQTGLGSGTVYPILERLRTAGHVTMRKEEPAPADRPSRLFCELTGTGRALAATARAPRQRVTWMTSRPGSYQASFTGNGEEHPGSSWMSSRLVVAVTMDASGAPGIE